ncbi:hypothetical protein [Fusibacter sp. 3D3]|uniref:hypothetical protein n=1 Tax=Fusibacter sp. 3D3 TaxID=1048380 RepID=UPI0008537853|nr:hypothetical protein [Fusibacter sp. 3D3]GAU80090.1 hypothetical protein F3D3_4756 [Fusibacter sp. 3D3]
MKKMIIILTVLLLGGIYSISEIQKNNFIPSDASVRDLKVNGAKITKSEDIQGFENAFLLFKIEKKKRHLEWNYPQNVSYEADFMVNHEIFHLLFSDNCIIYQSSEVYYIVEASSAEQMRNVLSQIDE